MKELFRTNQILNNLNQLIDNHLISIKDHIDRQKNNTKFIKDELSEEQTQFKEDRAAKLIQNIWRKRKIKKAMIASPYSSYLSLVDPDDDLKLLSSIMFGRREAEHDINSKERVDNPFIHRDALYHRGDKLNGKLWNILLSDFQISSADKLNNLYIPVSILKNSPIEEIMNNFFPNLAPPIRVIKDDEHTIGLLEIPKSNLSKDRIRSILICSGVIATPWEIAANAKTAVMDSTQEPKIILDDSLPETIEALLEHKIYGKLNHIAANKRYPTQKLAASLTKMLEELPELSPQAIQRIALMLDMTNTFYEYNYPRFAFCVYTIVHEISLSLLKAQDELEGMFDEFFAESEKTLLKSLDLNKEDLGETTFFASPAVSGTNAYAIAARLANKMQMPRGKKPSIKVFKPAYFEFDYVRTTTESPDADIFVITTGPVVSPQGLTPGVDINKMARRYMNGRIKPATLIIDATTTLYKNLKLDPDIKELVESGQLSLLVFESHQKFGLVHTDQAQYGRVFGVCAKNSFSEQVLSEFQENAKEDFNEHMDMRVGAYISSKCSNILEQIKEQHFKNGAILRNVLTHSSLASPSIVTHKEMMTNLNELYFINSPHPRLQEAVKGITAARNSFGHYQTNVGNVATQTRVSADASDEVDCLIQSAQIYLADRFATQKLYSMLKKLMQGGSSFTLSEQIILIAMLNNILIHIKSFEVSAQEGVIFSAMLHNILTQSESLRGRQYHNAIQEFYFNLKYNLVQRFGSGSDNLIKCTRILQDKSISINHATIDSLAKNEKAVSYIMTKHQELSKKELDGLIKIADITTDFKVFELIKIKPFLESIEVLENTVNDILHGLKSSRTKYLKAKEYAFIYRKNCYDALVEFYSNPSPQYIDKMQLLDSLELAKKDYCSEVLSKDRNLFAKFMRNTLKVLVNILAALTLGLAHYAHKKLTGHTLFYSRTDSEQKLERFHMLFEEEIVSSNYGEDEDLRYFAF